ncbi:4-hydroxybenzoate octaprenyltransferase [Vibrio parahaemolyticus]
MSAEKAKAYWQLMRMDRPIGSLLLLWPTVWALVIAAQGIPSWDVLIVFVLGVFLMRSAGCVINDFADRKVDGHVKRTKQRPLPSGKVTAKEAIGLFLVLAVSSFLLVLTMNPLTIQLSFAPVMVWFVFVINALWTIAYDTQYAMVDRDDDLKIGIKSTAILFGRHDKLIIGVLQLVTLAMLVGLGQFYQLGQSYYWTVLIAASLFVYQQHLIRHRERDLCFRAFLNNNYVGMVIAIGLLVAFW